MEHRQEELSVLLEPFEELKASICYRPDWMAITITIPPPWNAVMEPKALAVQERIREWSKQYPEMICYCFDSFSTLLYVLK